MTSDVLVSLIGATAMVLVGIITTRFIKPRSKNDFIDAAFAAQEGIMKRQDAEITSLKSEILRLTAKNAELEEENDKLRGRR